MEIKYFNSNFDKITKNKDIDQSITNVIKKLPSLNIISDKYLLEETVKISNQFKEKKEKIIVFGTGGSNLGARALNNIISNNKITLEFYDNVDPINFERKFPREALAKVIEKQKADALKDFYKKIRNATGVKTKDLKEIQHKGSKVFHDIFR